VAKALDEASVRLRSDDDPLLVAELDCQEDLDRSSEVLHSCESDCVFPWAELPPKAFFFANFQAGKGRLGIASGNSHFHKELDG